MMPKRKSSNAKGVEFRGLVERLLKFSQTLDLNIKWDSSARCNQMFSNIPSSQ